MELKDLAGEHTLDTAAIMSTRPPADKWTDEADVIAFGMDGKTFIAVEDPSDGYRSYMEDLEIHEGHTEALSGASPIGRAVVATHQSKPDPDDFGSYEQDVLTISDKETGHVWLRLGTTDIDDYYPGCVLEWNAMPTGSQ